MTVRAAICHATLLMGLFSSLFGCAKKQSLDEWALDQLKEAGADLSKPHKLEFQLHFPTQSAAEQAAPRLKVAGYEVAMKDDAQEGWLCVATKTMIPDLSALQKIHGELDSVATFFGGRYDGWGMAADE